MEREPDGRPWSTELLWAGASQRVIPQPQSIHGFRNASKPRLPKNPEDHRRRFGPRSSCVRFYSFGSSWKFQRRWRHGVSMHMAKRATQQTPLGRWPWTRCAQSHGPWMAMGIRVCLNDFDCCKEKTRKTGMPQLIFMWCQVPVPEPKKGQVLLTLSSKGWSNPFLTFHPLWTKGLLVGQVLFAVGIIAGSSNLLSAHTWHVFCPRKVELAAVNPIDWKLFSGGMHGICPVSRLKR